jgi:hypothetical protein
VFGYVKPFVPNLRVKEYELYKSVYCGLCRSMKKHTGNLSRVSLSYDMTFFALARMVLCETDFSIRKRRCAVHPLKNRPIMDDNESLSYASYVSALLTEHKIDDTVADDKGLKKVGAVMALPFSRKMKRRAMCAEYEIVSLVDEAMVTTRRLEAEKCPSPDMPADVFGKMLGDLLSLGFHGAKQRIANEIGLHTGRFVYLIDAICDYEDDLKNGSYNPFIYAFSEEEMRRFKAETLRGVLTIEADAILRAFDLLDFDGKPMFRECIENIIVDGMGSALSVAVGKEELYGE